MESYCSLMRARIIVTGAHLNGSQQRNEGIVKCEVRLWWDFALYILIHIHILLLSQRTNR
jgi:multisubunit Na+/H+ antiporter MnhE subunit